MNKIAVCYKWVLSDTDIRVNEQTLQLDLSRCKAQINEYDRMGLETGARLKEALGCELVGLTCGASVEASLKDVLSRGPDAAWYCQDKALAEADGRATAKTLAAMVRAIGDVDLVICSEGSSDRYEQQVGPRLAALLGFASLSYASAVTAEDGALLVERKLDDGVECVRVEGKAVLSVSPDICEAAIPSVKQILAARKKPTHALTLEGLGLSAADIDPGLKVAAVTAPRSERKALRLNPDGVGMDEAAEALAVHLAAEGVL